MKFILLIILLAISLTVKALPVNNVEENENSIPTKVSKGLSTVKEGNDLKPAEYFYPGLGIGFGFGYPGYGFYSRPYWHHFYGYRPYFTGYHSGLGGHGSHWHYRY